MFISHVNSKRQFSITIAKFFLLGILLSTCSHTVAAKSHLEIDHIATFSDRISPSGRIMAVVICPKERKSYDTENCFIYLLNLETGKHAKVLGTKNVLSIGMSWRNKEVDELYMPIIDYDKPFVYSMVGVNENGKTIFIKNESKEQLIFRSFRWSPNGEILSGFCSIEPGESLPEGSLALSFDQGETIEIFSQFPGDDLIPPVWISNKEFYVYDTFFVLNENKNAFLKTIGRIRKVSIHDKKLVNEQEVVEGEKVKLYGAINDKCVYRLNNTIFVGSQKIYSSKRMGAMVSGNRVAIESSDKSQITVIDPSGRVLFERPITEKQHLYAFSSENGGIYILEDKKQILQWDIDKKLKPTVVFEIPEKN